MAKPDILLISPPWRLAGWPSLALGTLKAHLKSVGVASVCSHMHFDVMARFGVARYEKISSGWELGEALYFSLYAPLEAVELLERTAAHLAGKNQPEMAALCNTEVAVDLEHATLQSLEELDFGQYGIVGLSVGALQLGASLYLARTIKEAAPRTKIVLGGSSVVGPLGSRILEHVPWVDVLVDGEGELALQSLARADGWSPEELSQIPGLRFREDDGSCVESSVRRVLSMDRIAPPDMDEYFDALTLADIGLFERVMPVEASRGCAWEHRRGDGKLRGCTFCGLYRGSPNFREKPLASVLNEIEHAASRYGALEISFTDAYLPPSYANELLRCIAESGIDVTLFCEMRCDMSAETAFLLAQAGARQVQLGVEAFHTPTLRKLAKGVRMIDNVYSIKLCEEHGVPLQYNLISRFPGVTAAELDETMALLPSLYGYTAPSIAEFYLDRGSRIFADPTLFGLDADTFDRAPLPFLPADLAGQGVCQVVSADFPASAAVTRGWKALEGAVAHWQALHKRLRADGSGPGLSYRDTGTTLIVTDGRHGDPIVLKLRGLMRTLLLACSHIVSKQSLYDLVPGRDAGTLDSALCLLRENRLIVEEGPLVLALPIRARLPGGAQRPQPGGRTEPVLRSMARA